MCPRVDTYKSCGQDERVFIQTFAGVSMVIVSYVAVDDVSSARGSVCSQMDASSLSERHDASRVCQQKLQIWTNESFSNRLQVAAHKLCTLASPQ